MEDPIFPPKVDDPIKPWTVRAKTSLWERIWHIARVEDVPQNEAVVVLLERVVRVWEEQNAGRTPKTSDAAEKKPKGAERKPKR